MNTSAQPSIFENVLVSYARRFPVHRGKMRLIDSLWRAASGDRDTHRLAELKYGGFKMTCDLNQALQRQYYFFGTYFLEEKILRCWESAAKNARVIFDVGANAGIYSLAALGTQPAAVVHAFEPTPEIAAQLKETATRNGLRNLHVHEVAVLGGNVQAVLKRYRGDKGTNDGMNFISQNSDESGAERVQAVSLDQFCGDKAIRRIDLLKLDIQGHEHTALKGAEHLLQNALIGSIFMELNWAENPRDASPAKESIALLEKAGYKFSAAGNYLDWKKSGTWMQNLTDIIAKQV